MSDNLPPGCTQADIDGPELPSWVEDRSAELQDQLAELLSFQTVLNARIARTADEPMPYEPDDLVAAIEDEIDTLNRALKNVWTDAVDHLRDMQNEAAEREAEWARYDS